MTRIILPSPLCFLVITITLFSMMCQGSRVGDWVTDAHATFYGDMKGNETMYGACGYKNLFEEGYGLYTAALSTALFNGGLACGSCYEVQCINSKWCKHGSVKITATNFCPPNYTKSVDIWCNPPQKHFDLSESMFVRIAEYKAGVVPVQFRRIPCLKKGGMKFLLQGNQGWLLVLVFNVAGAGDVTSVKIKGSNSNNWLQMTHNWGQNWQVTQSFLGQSLSFQVTTSDGRMVQSDNVVPGNWQFGQTFEGKNF